MPTQRNLYACHKLILKGCAAENKAFMKCKAENEDPRACAELGCASFPAPSIFAPRGGWSLTCFAPARRRSEVMGCTIGVYAAHPLATLKPAPAAARRLAHRRSSVLQDRQRCRRPAAGLC